LLKNDGLGTEKSQIKQFPIEDSGMDKILGKHAIRYGRSLKSNTSGEEGLAVLIALIALSMFSLLGLSMMLNSATEVRISDNYESQVQAENAALAGLHHGRELLRGLQFNDLLVGPDGSADSSTTYLTQAHTHSFRNPLSWRVARSLDILSPMSSLSTVSDDGIINTGHLGTTNGLPLIPLGGMALSSPNPYGSASKGDDTIVTGRYFVKVSDNNGEATETAIDAADNPFFDGDNIIIMRSMGVAQTVMENGGGALRRNSVAVYEARFKRRTTFDLDAPFVVQGDDVQPSSSNMFDGSAFRVDGGRSNYGIATIDTDTSNFTFPSDRIASSLDNNQDRNIRGQGVDPSIADITNAIASDPDKSLLLDPNYLWNFINNVLPLYADNYYEGNQTWTGFEEGLDLGTYDLTKPDNHPAQDPRVTMVKGDLRLGGNISGGGLLVVTGELTGNGAMNWNGLILVIGGGNFNGGGLNVGLDGGLYIANVSEDENGNKVFGTPKFTLSGACFITMHGAAINMAVRMLPPTQISFREITSVTDP
jgi:hypothetical protein